MLTIAEYNAPLAIVGGYFNGRVVSPYPDYLANYELHYLRYLYFMCVMECHGVYPMDWALDQLIEGFEQARINKICKPMIRNILIGEAPSRDPLLYFYNPGGPIHPAWSGAISAALFPGVVFPTKVDFLIACASSGFLLMDLFPYAIRYVNTKTRRYSIAVESAFGFVPAGAPFAPYPNSISDRLNDLLCCLNDELSIAFGLIRFGNPLLSNFGVAASFDAWLLGYHKVLRPVGGVSIHRHPHLPGASIFLRVCGLQGPFGPNSNLLNAAGFQ